MTICLAPGNSTSLSRLEYGQALLAIGSDVSHSALPALATPFAQVDATSDIGPNDSVKTLINWIESEAGPISDDLRAEVASLDWPA